jgi:hypothetical protein
MYYWLLLTHLTRRVAIFHRTISIWKRTWATKYHNEQLGDIVEAIGVEHCNDIKGVQGLHELYIEYHL